MIRVVVVAVALLGACSDDTVVGPFDDLRLDLDLTVGLDRPVHVARDKYGIAHITAKTVGDAAFVQGYVMAHDRLPQMDILRRFGAGTLSELFGALDPEVIDTDLEMRMHRMRPLARETWDRLRTSDRSNNWAVRSPYTGIDGPALLASDQHLQLPNPSIFDPTAGARTIATCSMSTISKRLTSMHRSPWTRSTPPARPAGYFAEDRWKTSRS
ncbi:MAG: penicillin acylase family protein [Deltaproteobacteria bacterium]|nr:penicillin acylase family protein [Deltaproteobacteria bacterium]